VEPAQVGSERLILKLGYIRYIYNYSGSRWHVGAPKDLDTMSILGFPTYKTASMLTLGTRFVSDPQRLGTAPSGLPSTQKRQVTGEWV